MKRRETRGGIGIFLLVVVVALAAGATWFFWKKNQPQAQNYGTRTVSRGELKVTVLSTGVVQPENRLEIKPPIAGRVEQVLVDEGYDVKKGQILAWMSSTERAGLLDAASAQGPEVLKRWEDFYKSTPIIAPIPGSIILRNVEPGQTFTSQDAVFVMSDRLTIKAQVDETDIAQIKLDQKAEVVLDAYPNEKIPAHVLKIAFDAKTVNNVTTYDIDVLPETTPPFMRSGMTANVTFFIASKADALLVPSEAVTIKDGKSFVLVKGPEKGTVPARREVVVGLTDGKRDEILSGVSENETLLVPQLAKQTSRGTNPFTPFSPRRGGTSGGR